MESQPHSTRLNEGNQISRVRGAASGSSMRRRALVLVLASVVIWSRIAWCDSLEAHLTAPHETLSLDEPVIASLLVRNTGGESTYLFLDHLGKRSVNVNVVDAEGDSHYVTANDARTCVDCLYFPASSDPFGSGEEVEVPLVLDRWHRFSTAGKYEVHVELQRQAVVDIFAVRPEQVEEDGAGIPFLPISDHEEAWLKEPVLRSNAVTINIGPRDEARLRKVAGDLLEAAEAGAYSAALALTRMVDPIAVPALADLIRLDGSYQVEALITIMQIGSPEAVDVLLHLEPSGDVLTREHIRGALREIALNPSADPVARRRAAKAIETARD